MNLQVELYIDASGNPLGEAKFERVDFFDFETIEVNSGIQDFRDISKVFTDYSQTFSIPASRKNNSILKHYYNISIENGFDARIKQRAEIHLNGILWKVGYIRLTKSTIKNGKANSYRVTFFGGLTNLGNVLGSTMLSDVSELDIYNHDYNIDNVFSGFTQGLQLSGDSMGVGNNRDVIYPSISVNDKWFYDSSGVSSPTEFNQGFSVNLYDNTGGSTYGVNWLSLKPAIKVKHIINAIQEKYSSINFSDDFFGTPEFDNLYMLLHNNKGVLAPSSSQIEDVSVTYRIGTGNQDSDFALDATFTEARPMTTYWESASTTEKRVFQYHIITNISNVTKSGGGTDAVYTIEILDGNVTIDRFQDITGDNSVTSVLCTENLREWSDVRIRVSSRTNELATFEIDLELKRVRYKIPFVGETTEHTCNVQNFIDTGGIPVEDSSLYSTSVAGTQTLIKRIEITKNIPKMKIIDFLTGIFKMFNLTALSNNQGVIEVKTLNQFYESGKSIDITNKVNNDEISVNRMDLFRNIEFKYSEPSTFGILNNNEISNTDFGNLEYQATSDGTDSSLVFDGKDYSVKLPFEKIYYERLFDENNILSRTEFGNGWLVDKDQNESLTKPIMFYNVVQPIDSSRTPIGFVGKSLVTQYNRASNSNSSEYFSGGVWNIIEGTKSVNFNTEFDEFSLTEVSRGLFRKHYQDYISNIFNKGTRVVELEIKADLAFLLKYKINDTLTILNEEYLINNIRTNLTTGITNLELVLKFFTETELDAVGAVLTTPAQPQLVFRNRDTIVFNWEANPSDQAIKGYKIYVDSVLVDTILLDTSYTLNDLLANTAYSIQISAYNSQNEESSLSPALSVTTLNTDTEAPSNPSNLRVNVLTELGVDIAWDASTDNVGVTGYDIYVDGVFNKTSTSTTTTIFGLSGATRYEVYVKAKDAAGNYSDISNTLIFKTLNFLRPALTDATFQQAVDDCLAQEPVTGLYNVVPYGLMKDWNTSQVTDMSSAFTSKSTFNGDISRWDTSNVTNMDSMFQGASAFNQDISAWDTSSVINMQGMFAAATIFNQPLNSWNVSSATNMASMFSFARAFDQPLNSWVTSSVTTMANMFNTAEVFNQDLNSWNVSSVTDMSSMFEAATSFNGDITGWSTDSVTNIGAMFKDATSFNKDIGGWDTSSVTIMGSTFNGASAFNGNVGSWNTGLVSSMGNMFKNAIVFNQNLNSWDVSNNGNMIGMFLGASAFNGNISGWTTTSLVNTQSMFTNAIAFNQDISGWSVSGVSDMRYMFQGCIVFNQDLSSWAVNPNVVNCADFDTGATAWVLPRPNFTSCTI
jgi:surface protein